MKPGRTCPGPRCGIRIEHWQRFCAACFLRLPAEQRAAISLAVTEKRVLDASRLTTAAALWLFEHSPAAEAARRQGEVLE